jgi:hypothetical protein
VVSRPALGARLIVRNGLELYNSRVSRIIVADDRAVVYFSVAYVHKGADALFVQEAQLIMEDAVVSTPMPTLPNTIAEGFLEVGGIRHELIPLPFERRVEAVLCVTFADGVELEVAGCRPTLELLGSPLRIEGGE